MDGPKKLVVDIETSPMLADVWDMWQQNVGMDQVRRDWFVLSWAAKWVGEEYVYSDCLPNYKKEYKADPEDDSMILMSLKDMIDEADIVIGHNSWRFDLPKIRARMVMHGIEPFSPVQSFDTLKAAKAVFKFSSNRLAFIGKALGLGEKLDTGGHLLWVGCVRGDPASWAKMVEYNENDVVLTEQVYHALSPWSTTHPNYGLYTDADCPVCVVCGSRDIRREGYAYTSLGKFQRYQCKSCGKFMRARQNVAKRDSLLTNVM